MVQSNQWQITLAGLLLLVTAVSIVSPADGCGELVTISTHDSTTIRYALAPPSSVSKPDAPIALVLLAGSGGYLDLDDKGCARALTGNSLVRSLPLFQEAGFFTALVDAPSDYPGEDGLAGFRIATRHAEDLGKVIADVRTRTKAPVWVVGTSRGTISAANAAARLSGPAAPNGVVLTSVLTVGQSGAKLAWVAQTVFDLPLESIRMPALLIGHAADLCTRSPAGRLSMVADRISSARKQVVTVLGSPAKAEGSLPNLGACQGRTPHGYYGQEAEVAAGMARFMRGQSY